MPRMDGPRVSVIIVSWNAGDVLVRCLDSIGRQEVAGGFETIVVDNASTDRTAAPLHERGASVRVIRNQHNAGFSAASNAAASMARGRVLFFLNPDTALLGRDVMERLARAVDAEDVAIAGPKLVNPDGTLQPSCAAHPSVARALLLASGLHRLLPDPLCARLAPERWSHAHAADTGWVKGAAMAMRAEVFRELAGFWPAMYAGEEDLVYRAQQRGLRVRFENLPVVMHIGSYSAARRWSDPAREARVASADLTFLRSHYSRPRAAAIRAIMLCGYLVRAVAHRILGRTGAADVYGAMARVYASGPLTDAR
jgi:GT2 family glycosyltransferase